MIENRRIVDLWHRTPPAVLATLVRVEGSSYRREGARLLIAQNGEYAGSISGGCLEAEVLQKAEWLTRNGAAVQQYSTLFDDTAEIPYGLGCGGIIHLLLEPAATPECVALLHSIERSLGGESARIITQLPGAEQTLRRCILDRTGRHVFQSAAGLVDHHLPHFAETMDPPQRLFVLGAGDDALPLVRFAAALGWRVTVIDGRAQWARPDRFPEAETVRCTNTLSPQTITSEDAVVIMTHSFEQDRDWLVAVLPAAPRYLGILGARHRSALLVAEAAARLGWPLDRACAGIFAPVGLDLGGDGAEAIALAAVAEIQACIQGKLGHSRRLTPEQMDQHLASGDATKYLRAQCAL